MPNELAAFLLAMVPGTESDAVIPLAITVWHLSYLRAFLFSILGNVVPFFVVYFGLDWLHAFCVRHLPRLVAPIDRIVEHTKKRLGKAYATYGTIALFVYVALPIPLTGVWSASIAASVFRVPYKSAAAGVIGGMILGAIIVTVLTLGAQTV